MKKDKWAQTAEELIKFVGKDNFESVANCMTRTRFYVIDKEKVDTKSIEKIETVKGFIWSGNELQVVIGGNAYKVKDAVNALMKDNGKGFDLKNKNAPKEKKSFWQRFLAAINGIITPLMPLLISTGLLMGISSILSNSGVTMSGPPEGGSITDMDLFSGIVYIISQTGLSLLSVFFCYSTVVYLGGNGAMGVLLGLMLASRYFVGGPGEWPLFKIGETQVAVKAYDNSFLPAVATGIIYVYLDKFIQKWMPGAIDILFRPLIATILTMTLAWFAVAPFLSIIEAGVSAGAIWFYEIPWGIGGMILGLIWQPIVFLGFGWPVWLAIDADFFTNGGPLRGLPIMDAAAIGMMGSVLVIALKSKSKKESMDAYGTMFPLALGITEPAMYGVTVPKGKPFWIHNIGAAVSGLLLALFGIARDNMAGGGILGILGFNNLGNGVLYLAFSALGIAINFVLTWFLYDDKPKDSSVFKKSIHKLTSFWKHNHKDSEISYKQDFAKFKEDFKVLDKKSATVTKQWVKLQKLERALSELDSKAENKSKLNKFKQWFNKNVEKKQLKLSIKIDKTQQLVDTNYQELQKLVDSLYPKIQKVLNKIDLGTYKENFENLFYNATYNTGIYTGAIEKKEDNLTKEIIFNTNNKWKLLVSF